MLNVNASQDWSRYDGHVLRDDPRVRVYVPPELCWNEAMTRGAAWNCLSTPRLNTTWLPFSWVTVAVPLKMCTDIAYGKDQPYPMTPVVEASAEL